ncbi:MAG: glycosyltransferase [Patescibacteria group bacterium]
MKLSIVIPTKNEALLLPKLLESIQRQELCDLEVIVADAYSTDQTREIAVSLGARVVDGGLPGPGRNRGAEVATGDVIAFFDADVILPSPRFLADCLAEMDVRSLDLATCRVMPLDSGATDDLLHEVYNLFAIATERVTPHAPGFCIFVRAVVHRAIQGFDERIVFAEDHDYAQRAVKTGAVFGILRGHRVGVSVRRLEKEGRLKLALKYIYGELHMRLKGPFTEGMPFEYEFANYTPSPKEGASEEAQKGEPNETV